MEVYGDTSNLTEISDNSYDIIRSFYVACVQSKTDK